MKISYNIYYNRPKIELSKIEYIVPIIFFLPFVSRDITFYKVSLSCLNETHVKIVKICEDNDSRGLYYYPKMM